MATISASAARQTLPAQLDRVEAGEEVAITRHGRVVALLVSPESHRRRRAASAWAEADRLGDQLVAARAALIPARLDADRAEELIATIRADRDAR